MPVRMEKCVEMSFVCANRKQDFRELKQLQREEMKEATDFYTRIRLDKEAQDKKFELENQVSQKCLFLPYVVMNVLLLLLICF